MLHCGMVVLYKAECSVCQYSRAHIHGSFQQGVRPASSFDASLLMTSASSDVEEHGFALGWQRAATKRAIATCGASLRRHAQMQAPRWHIHGQPSLEDSKAPGEGLRRVHSRETQIPAKGRVEHERNPQIQRSVIRASLVYVLNTNDDRSRRQYDMGFSGGQMPL